MFTQRFKLVVGAFVVLIIAAGLTYNQYKLQKQINLISHMQPVTIVREVVVTPTNTPTPTIALKYKLPVVKTGTTSAK